MNNIDWNNYTFTETTDHEDVIDIDWEEEVSGINLEEISPSVVEDGVRAALDSHEATFGWARVLQDNLKPTAGRLFKPKHFVPVKDRSAIEEEWPAYTFCWDASLAHHDHPVAHLVRELNEIEMLEDWSRENDQWIDLFGNAARADKYKRNCLVLYGLVTGKDYIRDQTNKHSKRRFPFDMEALCNPKHAYGKIKKISVTDSLYYLTMEDIGRILHTTEGRVMRSLVFRHSETSGTLNCGEQSYVVSENGIVTQWNVLTGEKYTHPTMEGLFHQGTAKTSFGGVAWSIRKAGGDNFIIDMVGCPNGVCEDYIPFNRLKEQAWEEFTYRELSVKKFYKWTWMSAKLGGGTIRITDTSLFEELRRYSACKPRTPRLKTELANLARRLCNPRDIISTHGGKHSDIPIASMSDYVELAMYIDVRHELEVSVSMYKENEKMVKALNKYYDTGSMPTDMTRELIAARVITGASVSLIKSAAEEVTSSVARIALDVGNGKSVGASVLAEATRSFLDTGEFICPEDMTYGEW